jgi:hypothetical protein
MSEVEDTQEYKEYTLANLLRFAGESASYLGYFPTVTTLTDAIAKIERPEGFSSQLDKISFEAHNRPRVDILLKGYERDPRETSLITTLDIARGYAERAGRPDIAELVDKAATQMWEKAGKIVDLTRMAEDSPNLQGAAFVDPLSPYVRGDKASAALTRAFEVATQQLAKTGAVDTETVYEALASGKAASLAKKPGGMKPT